MAAAKAHPMRNIATLVSGRIMLRKQRFSVKPVRIRVVRPFTSSVAYPSYQEHQQLRHDEAFQAERASPVNSIRNANRPAPATAEVSANTSMPPGWEDDPNYNISAFSQLPHRDFGFNQHIVINEEFKEALRQVLWQFRAPIRYAFAYGSGVFTQSSGSDSSSLSPHPHPPEAVVKWQKGGAKVIDFIFGVSYTQHWHSLNLQHHRDHYSFLGSLGSAIVSHVQDNIGAGVYYNPYITVNGIMIKYGVVNLDTMYRDLSTWDTLFLAGRLQKPVKILRDDPRIRLANQVNLISALRAALLMLGENFTEKDLYTAIAGISYMGDPRMQLGENPKKIANIVDNQLPNLRLLYHPLIENLPNVTYNDPRANSQSWFEDPDMSCKLQQNMDPVRRGNIVRRLPSKFRRKLYFHYQRKFQISGRDFEQILGATLDEDDSSFKRREGGEFERRIAGEDDIESAVAECIRKTVRWPSVAQSLKGILTAGPVRSWKYAAEKRRKLREVQPTSTIKGEEAGTRPDQTSKISFLGSVMASSERYYTILKRNPTAFMRRHPSEFATGFVPCQENGCTNHSGIADFKSMTLRTGSSYCTEHVKMSEINDRIDRIRGASGLEDITLIFYDLEMSRDGEIEQIGACTDSGKSLDLGESFSAFIRTSIWTNNSLFLRNSRAGKDETKIVLAAHYGSCHAHVQLLKTMMKCGIKPPNYTLVDTLAMFKTIKGRNETADLHKLVDKYVPGYDHTPHDADSDADTLRLVTTVAFSSPPAKLICSAFSISCKSFLDRSGLAMYVPSPIVSVYQDIIRSTTARGYAKRSSVDDDCTSDHSDLSRSTL